MDDPGPPAMGAPDEELGEAMRVLQFDRGVLHPHIAERRVLHYAEPWRRPPPRLFLNLSGRPAPTAERLMLGHRLTGFRAIDTFKYAELTWSDCFVLGHLFQNSFADTGEQAARIMTTRDAGSLAQLTSGIVATPSGYAIPEAKYADAVHVPGSTFFATPHEPHNWGLWLISTMTALERFSREPLLYDNLFVYAHGPNMRAMLDMMGVPERRIIRHDVFKSYRFESVALRRAHKWRFHLYPHEHDFLRSLARRQGAGSPTKRIFVSRGARSRDGYRQLLNEDALIDALASLGFATIEPDLLSASMQMRLFAEADAVVGLGGAGMFNTVFCKPGTKVLDIESTRVFLEPHADLFASLGMDYGIIVGAEDASDPRPSHRRWHLDIDAALPAIRCFLDR